MNVPLRLSTVNVFSEPFRYFTSPEALNPDVSDAVLKWFETSEAWTLVETDFYEQYEFSLWEVEVPAALSFLRAPGFLAAIKTKIENFFEITLSDRLDITAHKLIPGQRIRLHNDFIHGAETHRLFIQFNRDWSDKNGGLLVLFNSFDPVDIHKVFQPSHNSAFGFAISPHSNHAVSKLNAGVRFTLVYSFYEQKKIG